MVVWRLPPRQNRTTEMTSNDLLESPFSLSSQDKHPLIDTPINP